MIFVNCVAYPVVRMSQGEPIDACATVGPLLNRPDMSVAGLIETVKNTLD